MGTTRDAWGLCCSCGAASDLLHREEGHLFCPDCVSRLGREVWRRVEWGAPSAEAALSGILSERVLNCAAWTSRREPCR